MNIVTLVGARPQFIKASVVSRALRRANISEVMVHTGQHFDANMSDVFFKEMEIPLPQYPLGIHSLPHGAMTGRMTEKIEAVLLKEKPDWVLVYGDTDSTLAGALAAKKSHFKLAHVEAGLRSFNLRMPEEQNRLVADRLSDLLFCPTAQAMKNLKRETIASSPYGQKAHRVGDVMLDAVLFFLKRAKKRSHIVEALKLTPEKFVLATVHRAENTDDLSRLKNIFEALSAIGETMPVLLPLHPRTQNVLKKNRLSFPRVTIIPPLSYFDMLVLEDACRLILTDSGGMQKEAFFLKKFCITLRDETEWIELVSAGVNFLAGASTNRIVKLFEHLKDAPKKHFSRQLYGDGHAADKIARLLAKAG